MSRICMYLSLAALTTACAAPGRSTHVLAHPIFKQSYFCGEHAAGELRRVGDALGTDCVIYQLGSVNGRTWARWYVGNGDRNEDWYGWGKEVLSPCDCKVVKLRINPETNEPGRLGKPPASSIELAREDGVHFVLGHIESPQVGEGERIRAGQAIARVGNNGYSRNPHIHLGAWNGTTPLQIRFDLDALGAIRRDE